MKIKILALGKIKEKFLKEGIDEFVKRLSIYSPIEILELQPVEIKDENLIESVLDKEAEKILSLIKPNSFVVTLDVLGVSFSSEKFAAKIDEIIKSGHNELVFVIGSSYGLSKLVSQRADLRLSLSSLTFLHQFARLILVEQIYRAFKILRGETYHK